MTLHPSKPGTLTSALLLCLAAVGASPVAGGVRDSYPLNQGDWKEYRSAYGTDRHSFAQASFAGRKLLEESHSLTGSRMYLQHSGAQLVWYGGRVGEATLTFDRSLVLLEDQMLPTGGSRTSATTVKFEGVTFTLNLTVTVTVGGTVTVPAGTYQDCRLMRFELTASAMGEEETAAVDVMYLAPGIGRVKSAIVDEDFEVIGWEELVAGSVAGKPVQRKVPTITTNSPLPGGTVGATYSATFEATGGTPPYTWTKVTGDLPPGLSLDSGPGTIRGTPRVAGTFTVRVRVTDADAQFAEKEFALTINPAVTPPKITLHPQDQTVLEGSTVTFSVVATGTGPLSYQWRFNEANVPGAASASFVINSVRTADAGSYDVVVSNAAGSVTSSPAHLTVNAPSPPHLRLSRVGSLPERAFELTVTGPVGGRYLLQTSTDLVGWADWMQVVSTNATMQFIDPDTRNARHRFYRVFVLP